jgi:hypothetical protein
VDSSAVKDVHKSSIARNLSVVLILAIGSIVGMASKLMINGPLSRFLVCASG